MTIILETEKMAKPIAYSLIRKSYLLPLIIAGLIKDGHLYQKRNLVLVEYHLLVHHPYTSF